jgi:protoporphyrin/coproporphyrin ferrochelatase
MEILDSKRAFLLVNFGGPRSLEEIYPFLRCLLTDSDLIRPSLPKPLHRLLFQWIAKKRARTLQSEYEKMGGKSPIFADTERLAELLRPSLKGPLLTFHRYLVNTHASFIEKVKEFKDFEWTIFPLFPQFSFTTTGSIARFFQERLPSAIVKRFHWIRSYANHPLFIQAFVEQIQKQLTHLDWKEEETLLLFSPHGLPIAFVRQGDPYETECESSFHEIAKRFPKAQSILSYQSQFGRQPWLKPSTATISAHIQAHALSRKKVLVIPLSFTSDHIETLVEVEHQYLPLIRKQGFLAERCPALAHQKNWIETIYQIALENNYSKNEELIRL